ncbi:hypothetical protein LSH36_1345g00036, partial [Paralvinella palmiformis]
MSYFLFRFRLSQREVQVFVLFETIDCHIFYFGLGYHNEKYRFLYCLRPLIVIFSLFRF